MVLLVAAAAPTTVPAAAEVMVVAVAARRAPRPCCWRGSAATATDRPSRWLTSSTGPL